MKRKPRPIVVDAVETEEQRGERIWRDICLQAEFTAAQVALETQMIADRCAEEHRELMTRLGYEQDDYGFWRKKE